MTSEDQEVKEHKKRGGVGKKVTKSTNRYKNTKYKALEPEINLKSRYEEIEDIASYAKDLPEEAKDWLNRFTQEYVCANFKHKGEKIHTTEKLRKSCFNRNNARNRDVYTQQKAQNSLNYIEDYRTIEENIDDSGDSE